MLGKIPQNGDFGVFSNVQIFSALLNCFASLQFLVEKYATARWPL